MVYLIKTYKNSLLICFFIKRPILRIIISINKNFPQNGSLYKNKYKATNLNNYNI